MKGGTAFFCPSCNERQIAGKPGDKLELPMTVTCQKCGASVTLEKSLSGGVHPRTGAGAVK
ncbi:MAG TPA: hypothetical protein VJ957_06620 [Longimicrobiales bacterium]|nr:hypothetical protein [Longimicrobiales bacterium]